MRRRRGAHGAGRLICALLLAAAPLAGCAARGPAPAAASRDAAIASAYEQGRSGVQVSGTGTVVRILPDDVNGDRHQRFILELASGQTLLITHNIDIAPRIPDLAEGDEVEFHGVYEWNAEGGVVHWTHHDPAGSHEPGWLRHRGSTYQ